MQAAPYACRSPIQLSVWLTPAASLGVSYTGQIGARAQDHAAKGAFTVRF